MTDFHRPAPPTSDHPMKFSDLTIGQRFRFFVTGALLHKTGVREYDNAGWPSQRSLVASNINQRVLLEPAPAIDGGFRLSCQVGHMPTDDPLVVPGQPAEPVPGALGDLIKRLRADPSVLRNEAAKHLELVYRWGLWNYQARLKDGGKLAATLPPFPHPSPVEAPDFYTFEVCDEGVTIAICQHPDREVALAEALELARDPARVRVDLYEQVELDWQKA